MLRKAILALCLCFGIGLASSPAANAAPPLAAGITAALPAPSVEQARYYRRYYVRRRFYRPRYYRRRFYYRPRYYRRYHYYRPRFYRFF